MKLGDTMSWLLLIGISLGLLLTGIGAYLVFKKSPFDKVAIAEVVTVECADGKCSVELKFVDVTQKPYIKKAKLNAPIEKGEEITVIYDSSNPNNFYPGNPPVKMVGSVVGFFGIFVLIACISSWLLRPTPKLEDTVSFTETSKPFNEFEEPETSKPFVEFEKSETSKPFIDSTISTDTIKTTDELDLSPKVLSPQSTDKPTSPQ